MEIEIRTARADQMHLLEEWAVREGWGAGIGDVGAFHDADPEGFLLAYQGDQPVGSVSAVRYDEDYAFLGYFIVEPGRRDEGIGHRLVEAAFARVGSAASGLDGVQQQVPTYAALGFTAAHDTSRFEGSAAIIAAALAAEALDVLDVRDPDIDELVEYDARHVPAPRPRFVHAWVVPGSATRRTYVARRGGRIAGYATVRRMIGGGSRIGPLFADDDVIARGLLAATAASGMAWGEGIAIDVPVPNQSAVELVRGLGMTSSYTCTRMYRGDVRPLPLDRIWGNTTFELG